MSYGRRIIYSDATEITIENVAEEVRKAALIHDGNRNEIQRLYEYYCGKTAILSKEKETRPEINFRICENHPFEIVSFHKGYTFGEAIQYVRRENATSKEEDDGVAAEINALNGYMADADKLSCDNDLAEWLYIAGTSYRLTLPNAEWEKDGDEAPFCLYALDPRQTFVVYSNSVDHRPLMGVYRVLRDDNEKVYSVYTKDSYFEFTEYGTVTVKPHLLGAIPIIEYPANSARLGVFEVVLPLLDALNELQSNRMDDIVQYVNSFLAIIGAQLDDETYKKLNEWKTLCLPEGTDAKFLSPTMSQSDVQTLKDDLLNMIYSICCVPSRSDGSGGTSDNGCAVILRNGWESAEAKAKDTETQFKRPEKMFLKQILRILRDTVGTKLRLTDIVAHFTRRNYENIATKSQVLIAMLNNPKIHPELAFAHSGLFPDPESAYLQSMAYYEEQMEKWQPIEVTEDVSKPRSPTGNNQEKNTA